MGKLTILFIIVSFYAFYAYSTIFHGHCDKIVNENFCIDKNYFESFTKPKSFQVIAHLKFNEIEGINLFYSYLSKNLIATISNDGEIVFSINCFKIPFDIKYQKNVNFHLKVLGCNTIDAEFRTGNDTNRELFNYINRTPILSTIYKIDNYFTIWGCNTYLEHMTDRAAWILLDNDGQIEYDAEKMHGYLDDFLKKFKPTLNKTGLGHLRSDFFTIYSITNEFHSCYDTLNQNAVFLQIKSDFPKNVNVRNTTQTLIEEDETKLKITVALLMITGHVLFMIAFFYIGYQIVIRCFKE